MARTLPDGERLWSLEAEAAVLGSMIIDKDVIPHVLGVITRTDMFFRPEHHSIFDAIVNLHIKNNPTDAIALRTELKISNKLEFIGGVSYLGKIVESVPSSANAVYYCKIIRDRATYRNMIAVLDKMWAVPREPGQVNEQIEKVHQLALSLQPDKDDEAHEFKDDVLESMMTLGDKKNLMPTGFEAIDRIINGFYPNEMVIIAGRPGMGKSVLSQDIGMFLAKLAKKVIFFSMEMSYEAIMQRAICANAMVNASEWHGMPPGTEFEEVLAAAQRLQEREVVVYETVETPEKMHAIASIRKKTVGVDLICIDHIQLMTTNRFYTKRVAQVTEISRQLKRMAMNLNIPVIVISQLNRECEGRRNHRPRLSDLRDSGSIEQDADVVMLLHREDQYRVLKDPDIDPNEFDGIAEIIIAKNRRGRTGIAKLLFRDQYTTFVNLSSKEAELEFEGGKGE